MRSEPTVFLDYDRNALDRQYSPSSLVPDLGFYLDEYAALSAAARERHRVLRGVRYGPHPDETLDYFPAASPGAALHVFVHGGFWQQLSKDESAFAAPGFLAAGAAFAALNYGLAPAHRLDDIVDMTRRAVRWLYRNASQLDFDRDRIHLSGSSAGAHLVAMALTSDRAGEPAPGRAIASVTLLSGVYDLEPVSRCYVNDVMRLSEIEARRNSPIHHLPPELPPVVIARGGNETDEFVRQHDEMAAALRRLRPVVEVVSAARDHFDLPYELADPGTPLGRAVLGQMGLAMPHGAVPAQGVAR